MARMSNRDRIARAAEEARLTAEEKTAKKKATKKATKRPSRARSKAKAVRMKIVWAIHNSQGTPLMTYAYPDKEAAEAEALALTRSTGSPHELRATKVPMEDD